MTVSEASTPVYEAADEVAGAIGERRVVRTTRFGEVTYAEREVICFPWGLPGFPGLHAFLALSLAGQERFVWLQSLDDPAVALPVTDPWQFFADYEPTLPPYARVALALDDPEQIAVLCVVVASAAAPPTVNLLAPIVINLATNVGRQVMLESSAYSVRTPLPVDAPRLRLIDGGRSADGPEYLEEALPS